MKQAFIDIIYKNIIKLIYINKAINEIYYLIKKNIKKLNNCSVSEGVGGPPVERGIPSIPFGKIKIQK